LPYLVISNEKIFEFENIFKHICSPSSSGNFLRFQIRLFNSDCSSFKESDYNIFLHLLLVHNGVHLVESGNSSPCCIRSLALLDMQGAAEESAAAAAQVANR
jgi:hypothetical protein